MKVIFRADASLDIGTGHVIRCLTLADALRDQFGASCDFICRAHAGHLEALVSQRGHGVTLLPLACNSAASSLEWAQSGHASWLGKDITQEADASDTVRAIRANSGIGCSSEPDWVVVDHYALDRAWEIRLRAVSRRLMVIDDLADRRHECDLLLDQNPGRLESDYAAQVAPQVVRLIGPSYALLRPEFAQWRPRSLARRAERWCLRHLLITMGGVDRDNVTGQVLEAISASQLADDIRITVVMGPTAPWLAQVRRLAATLPNPVEVLSGVSNMAQLMADADLAIGAAGGSALERCCLGLPSILLVLASNQRQGASALAARQAALIAESVEQVPHLLHRLLALPVAEGLPTLASLAEATSAIADGGGVGRVVAALKDCPPVPETAATGSAPEALVVRKVREVDLAMVLAWRNDPEVRRHMLTRHEISLEEHIDWYAKASQDPSRCLLIVEEAGQHLGYVQFSDVRPGTAANWGFYAVPGASRGSGRKLGAAALEYAFRHLRVHKVCGQALASNRASIKFHQALGFRQEGCLREQHLIDEQWLGIVCFGLLASEWASGELCA